MARKHPPGLPSQNGSSHLKRPGEDAPPRSTAAAQIVVSRAHATQEQPGNLELFDRLLDECLTETAAEETSRRTNATLLTVVADTGLEALRSRDPFAPDAAIRRASISLKVLEVTIQRDPEILFYHGEQATPFVENPPLLLQLLPKILGSTGRKEIYPQTITFLSNAIHLILTSGNLWKQGSNILDIVQSMIDHGLLAIEHEAHARPHEHRDFSVTLPSAQTLERLWSGVQVSIAIPQDLQITIPNSLQARQIVSCLLATALDMGRLRPNWVSSFTPEFTRQLEWGIEYCRRVVSSCGGLSPVQLSLLSPTFGVLCDITSVFVRLSGVPTKVLLPISANIICLASTMGTVGFQNSLARLLLHLLDQCASSMPEFRSVVDEWIGNTVLGLVRDEPWFCRQGEALQCALVMWTNVFQKTGPFPKAVEDLQLALRAGTPLKLPPSDPGDSESGFNLKITSTVTNEHLDVRPPKRIRVEPTVKSYHEERYSELVEQISAVIHAGGGYVDENLVPEVITLSEDDRCRLFQLMRYLPCAGCSTLVPTGDVPIGFTCSICNSPPLAKPLLPHTSWNTQNPVHFKVVITMFHALIADQDFRRSENQRTLMAWLMNRVFAHIDDVDVLQLESTFAEWCLRSMQSSSSELRIAAAQCLGSFIREGMPSELLTTNRRTYLEFLRKISARNTLDEQATLIYTWGTVGRYGGEQELNLVLLQLVQYLGHPQAVVSGLAAEEIEALADNLSKSVTELFRPFWRSVAPGVVQDIFSCPQKAQKLADLLHLSVNDLLVLTQPDTVPYLTLKKQKEVLQRIATARGPNTPIRDLWTHPVRNVAALVSPRLLQYHSEPCKSIARILKEIDPHFTESEVEKMISAEPVHIAVEILKVSRDSTGKRREEILPALRALASIVEHSTGTAKSTSKSRKALDSFFDNQILGIMASFTEIIDTPKDRVLISEKKENLQAVESLISIAPVQIGIALPQVTATLQSALEFPELVDQAFSTWATLINSVIEDDVESIIDQTFTIIVQNWSSFSSQTQKLAYDTIADLLKRHNSIVQDRIEMIPSLDGIELLAKFASEIKRFKSSIDPITSLEAFCCRCQDENFTVVYQSLSELVPFLTDNQRLLHESAISQQPSPVISQLYRVLLDVSVRFKEGHDAMLDLCGQCLGILGSVDPNKIEAIREKRELLMLSNFGRATEVVDFVAYMLESVIVPAFHAASSGKAQSYLAYVMQELLKSGGFRQVVLARQRPSESDPVYRRWNQIPEIIRFTLMPFFDSKYFFINASNSSEQPKFPIFRPQLGHGSWARSVVFNLLLRPNEENAKIVFPILSRVIWGHDIAIAASLLPFVVQNAVVGGTEEDFADVSEEFLAILLHHDISNLSPEETENVKHCSESVFQVLDYLSRCLQEKRRFVREFASGSHRVTMPEGFDVTQEVTQISRLEKLLTSIPAEAISTRALQCRSYARALSYWEQFIRKIEIRAEEDKDQAKLDTYYRRLQDIYAHIEEPDGIEGISAQLHILDPEQQILEHKRAGRWTAVQSWYEMALANDPTDELARKELLSCLKASGKYEALLTLAQQWVRSEPASSNLVLPYATEAAWRTSNWDVLFRLLESKSANLSPDFNVEVGEILQHLRASRTSDFESGITKLRKNITRGFSTATTGSLASAHSHTLKLHALYEIAAIVKIRSGLEDRSSLFEVLDRRLELLGACTDDKQYLLGIRRAVMEISGCNPSQIAGTWLSTSRLARKANDLNVAYDAVLHATKLEDLSATIEHSRILWKDGAPRKAINNLKGAIEAGVFQSYNIAAVQDSVDIRDNPPKEQNPLVSKTQLLLAKWLDQAGLIKSMELLKFYQQAQHSYNRSQSPTYYLGKYYNKILDTEAALPKEKQSEHYTTGEVKKLAIDNYLRSMAFGSKYYYETVPKVLTLWLDFGAEIAADNENSRRLTQAEKHALALKTKRLDNMHKQLQKYIDRLPPYIWYTALSQIMSRINHPHPPVADELSKLIKKIVATYPQQALWSLLAVAKAKDPHKQMRASTILLALRSPQKGASKADLNILVSHGQRLTDALLGACEKIVDARSTKVSLHKDLDLNPKLAPCPLVVPIEKTMMASLPSVQSAQAIRGNKPFPVNAVTIASFQDEVLVLNSLQRPRKITLRGSDGQSYALLCKPKDDLRKDNRLMEFNTLISRCLKRDVESSKRRLYIRTYAVTPLNEECGAIEWVDGLKPMRDIIIAAYKNKGVRPDYAQIRQLLDQACADPDNDSHTIFTDQILPKFAPILYEWFIETFPEPESWFQARLRYTRSAAVMSIVGHVLGLGDRHGENILLEEGNGGVFHVDFNCLFDKGLTFEKPELVPFRLTHNMIDAMGAYGYEGPFRTACELTLKCLRQYQDTLMTILETFLYDPTADFVGKTGGGGKKKDKGGSAAVPESPKEVLESVRGKIRGLLSGENMPLSVDGCVDQLIWMAVDPRRLCAMYIGWCAFF